MNLKIEDVKRDIEESKTVVEKEKKVLNIIVRPNTIVAKEYRTLVKSKLEKEWKEKKR